MKAKALLAEVLRVAGLLGLARWERVVLILAVSLFWVLGERGAKALREVKLEPPPLEPPSDDGRPAGLPPAQVVASDGTLVQLGRTPGQFEADERESGSGG